MPRLLWLWLVVWPYHMTFHHSTLNPITGIAKAATFKDKAHVIEAMHMWREAKYRELEFIKVASTVSAGAVIGVFSWPAIEDGPWVATALWYSSLLFSLWAGISSAQQGWLLDAMPPLSVELESRIELERILRAVLRQSVDGSLPGCDLSGRVDGLEKIDWNMVYVWQVPIMLMSYSWATFLLALGINVGAPLIHGPWWSNDHKIAITFVSLSGILLVNFIWCSHWAYKNARIREITKVFKPGPIAMDRTLPHDKSLPQAIEKRLDISASV